MDKDVVKMAEDILKIPKQKSEDDYNRIIKFCNRVIDMAIALKIQTWEEQYGRRI